MWASPREEGRMGARRQKILMWVPNRSASNITSSEILGSTLPWSICPPDTLCATPLYSPKHTHPFKVPFSSSPECFKLNSVIQKRWGYRKNREEKKCLKTGKHFYRPTWSVVCSSPICWKHWKAFPNISNICWVGRTPPLFRSTHHLCNQQASY